MIDRSLVYSSYPQDRINTQVIYRFALAQVGCTSYCLLTNCKQKITSLSVFVGTTIDNLPTIICKGVFAAFWITCKISHEI